MFIENENNSSTWVVILFGAPQGFNIKIAIIQYLFALFILMWMIIRHTLLLIMLMIFSA